MQADEFHVFHRGCFFNHPFHIAHGNAKLILRQPSRDVGMSMSADIGIDAETHLRNLSLLLSQFVDDFQLGNTLHVEAEDILVET